MSNAVDGMSLHEREKALSAERMRRQDAAGWTRGAHIPGTSIDWRVEALALEAQLAGAVGALATIAKPGGNTSALVNAAGYARGWLVANGHPDPWGQ